MMIITQCTHGALPLSFVYPSSGDAEAAEAAKIPTFDLKTGFVTGHFLLWICRVTAVIPESITFHSHPTTTAAD